jgi:RimJ/RimL family protein N-acetyltransferase
MLRLLGSVIPSPQPNPLPLAHEASSRHGASLADPISVTDGLVQIRPATGPVSNPAGAIVVGGRVVGRVEYSCLASGGADVALRYRLRPAADDRVDVAVRAVQLVMHHLATRTSYLTAALHPRYTDTASLAVATAAKFTRRQVVGAHLLTRAVPPLSYSDGVVTIRRQRADDIDAHLEAIDEEQIRWLWMPGDGDKWAAMRPDQRLAHNVSHLRACRESFGRGPKWTFSVDGQNAQYIAYVDCDLANDGVPAGDANISYTCHPAHRGRGYVSRAVRLVHEFLRDHTGATKAYIIVDAENTASIRVARAVGATQAGSWRNEHGRTMIRHVVTLRQTASTGSS